MIRFCIDCDFYLLFLDQVQSTSILKGSIDSKTTESLITNGKHLDNNSGVVEGCSNYVECRELKQFTGKSRINGVIFTLYKRFLSCQELKQLTGMYVVYQFVNPN